MSKTLYVTDLDGTLLRSDQTLSPYTVRTINALLERGLLFSFATARSLVSTQKVTAGLVPKIPMIIYNGAFIVRGSGERLRTNFFTRDEAVEILRALLQAGVAPLLYSIDHGAEYFSFVPDSLHPGAKDFCESRLGDPRYHPVASYDPLLDGEVFYFTCIHEPQALEPVWRRFEDRFSCVYQRDIYSGEQWLEIMPKAATKAQAALQLKQLFGCDRLVCFGDGRNDIPMFQIADERYAVANADPLLKKLATAIIPSNEEDGVANWLLKHAEV